MREASILVTGGFSIDFEPITKTVVEESLRPLVELCPLIQEALRCDLEQAVAIAEEAFDGLQVRLYMRGLKTGLYYPVSHPEDVEALMNEFWIATSIPEIDPSVEWSHWRVSPLDFELLVARSTRKEVVEVGRPVKPKARASQTRQVTEARVHGRWPWGTHHTRRLENLEAAAMRFWVNIDPTDISTYPTNDEVIDWLKAERSVSHAEAKAVATLLRPDDLRPGPRK